MWAVKWGGIGVVALSLAACASGKENGGAAFYQPAAPEEAVVVVRNDNTTAMDIYAVDAAMRWRLGSVPTGKTANLRIPASFAIRSDIQLQADPFGPDAPFTFPRVAIRPGATLEMNVASSLTSSVLVF